MHTVTIRAPFHSPVDLPSATALVREAFARHEVVALPTETFYGLAVPPGDEEAMARLFAVKRRPLDKAVPVVVASIKQAETLVKVPQRWRKRLADTWPAPLTAVLPMRGGGSLAVRVPAHSLLRALLDQVGPLTATSANRAGLPPAATPEEVEAALGEDLALLLDGGQTSGGAPSTLLDLTSDQPRLLRPGAWAVPAAWDVKSV